MLRDLQRPSYEGGSWLFERDKECLKNFNAQLFRSFLSTFWRKNLDSSQVVISFQLPMGRNLNYSTFHARFTTSILMRREVLSKSETLPMRSRARLWRTSLIHNEGSP